MPIIFASSLPSFYDNYDVLYSNNYWVGIVLKCSILTDLVLYYIYYLLLFSFSYFLIMLLQSIEVWIT